MREILFRGKAIKNGKFVYGFLMRRNVIDVNDPLYNDGKHICDRFTPRSVELDTIGQYTGLNDKNGVKIFEGDRVKIVKEFSDGSDWSIEGVVSFENGSFFIEDSHKNGYTCVNNFDGLIEIIGKIHDKEQG